MSLRTDYILLEAQRGVSARSPVFSDLLNIYYDLQAIQSSIGSGLVLQTNSVANGSQVLLNLVAGTNISLIDNGLGRVTITGTGGGGGGTVTSVAALTLGTAGTDLTSIVVNGTTTPVITLNVPTASALNRGALSASDWTTFNSKLSYGDFVIGGHSKEVLFIDASNNLASSPLFTYDVNNFVAILSVDDGSTNKSAITLNPSNLDLTANTSGGNLVGITIDATAPSIGWRDISGVYTYLPLTFTNPTDDGKVLTLDSSTGQTSWQATASPTPSLTATQIAYGDGSNLMTSNAAFTFNVTDDRFTFSSTINGDQGIFYNGTGAPNGLNAHKGVGIDFFAGAELYTLGNTNALQTNIEIDNIAHTYTLSSLAGNGVGIVGVDNTGVLSWVSSSSLVPSLTATQIAFGDGSNLMTSSSDLIYNPSVQFLANLTDGVNFSGGFSINSGQTFLQYNDLIGSNVSTLNATGTEMTVSHSNLAGDTGQFIANDTSAVTSFFSVAGALMSENTLDVSQNTAQMTDSINFNAVSSLTPTGNEYLFNDIANGVINDFTQTTLGTNITTTLANTNVGTYSVGSLGMALSYTDSGVSFNSAIHLNPTVAALSFLNIGTGFHTGFVIQDRSVSLGIISDRTQFVINDNNGELLMFATYNGVTQVSNFDAHYKDDGSVGTTTFGDLTSANNGTIFVLDDVAELISIYTKYNGFPSLSFSSVWQNDGVVGRITMGDQSNAKNNTIFILDDVAQTYTFNKLGGGGNKLVSVDNSGVLGTVQATGWGTPTGTLSRAAFDASTVTYLTLAQTVAALQTDLLTLTALHS